MQWASGHNSSNLATVNYSGRGARDVFNFPGSGTCSVIHIASRSNIDIPGMFIFYVNETGLKFGNNFCLF